MLSKDGYECVERKCCTGVVAVIAVTPNNELILVDQFRPPMGGNVIELPAGLVGDKPNEGDQGDPEATAALRELMEETGYTSDTIIPMCHGPVSPGMTSEALTILLATGCQKMASGGGVAAEGEEITVHVVPQKELDQWLTAQEEAGKSVDLKVRLAQCLMAYSG